MKRGILYALLILFTFFNHPSLLPAAKAAITDIEVTTPPKGTSLIDEETGFIGERAPFIHCQFIHAGGIYHFNLLETELATMKHYKDLVTWFHNRLRKVVSPSAVFSFYFFIHIPQKGGCVIKKTAFTRTADNWFYINALIIKPEETHRQRTLCREIV